MRHIKALNIILCAALLTLAACREKYVPTLNSSGKGVLVVEGFIAIGPQVQTKIILSGQQTCPPLRSTMKPRQTEYPGGNGYYIPAYRNIQWQLYFSTTHTHTRQQIPVADNNGRG
jgi:hypothetical protein